MRKAEEWWFNVERLGGVEQNVKTSSRQNLWVKLDF